MKKIFCLINVLSILIFSPIPLSWAEDRTFIYDYSGNVILRRNSVGQKLKPDIPIRQGDIVKTDINGTVDIVMNQLAGVRLSKGAECLFDNIGSSSTHLVLSEGHALLNLKPLLSGEFSIETPTVVIQTNLASQFSCKINEDGNKTSTIIAVKKGRVEVQVKASGAAINLLQEQALEVSSGTFISAPHSITKEESDSLRQVNAIIISDEEIS